MQEHFPAGAYMPTIPTNEELPLAIVRYAGNAGAFSGGCTCAHYPEERVLLLAIVVRVAGNAEAFGGSRKSAHQRVAQPSAGEPLRHCPQVQIADVGASAAD
jgi:hypothetical protein